MKNNFLEKSDTEKQDVWLTAEQIVQMGLSDLPTSIAGIHYRATSQGWEKRKKEGVKGGKAVEYRLASIPEPESSAISRSMPSTDACINANECVDESSTYTRLMAIFTLMTELERLRAIKLFKTGGLNALMPDVLDADSKSTQREIFGEGSSPARTTLADEANPHDKKAG
ncbi:DNA-binding protein [Serratia marcescens]